MKKSNTIIRILIGLILIALMIDIILIWKNKKEQKESLNISEVNNEEKVNEIKYFCSTKDVKNEKIKDIKYQSREEYSFAVLNGPLMNDTNTTEGGFVNSSMYKTTLPNYLKEYVTPVFGSHVITFRKILSNGINKDAIINGGATGVVNSIAYYDVSIDLMNEFNVYGTKMSGQPADAGIDNRQYALFDINAERIITNVKGERIGGYALKTVSNASRYAAVFHHGLIGNVPAASPQGVRPCFLIG